MAESEAHVAELGVLYQDARWPGTARLIYGFLLGPLWILAAVDVIQPATTRVAGICFLLIVSLAVAACEARARRMGIIVSVDALILVRALNRTQVEWGDIEGFDEAAFGMWGERRLRVRRRGRFSGTQPAIPTLVLTPTRSWWKWYFRPARLCSEAGEIDDPVAFLRSHLERPIAT